MIVTSYNCDFGPNDGVTPCAYCGELPLNGAPNTLRMCYKRPMPPQLRMQYGSPALKGPPPAEGAGTELSKFLKNDLKIEATLTCSCNSSMNHMNFMGIGWCENNTAWILKVLKHEHDHHGWNFWDEDFVRDVILAEVFRRARSNSTR